MESSAPLTAPSKRELAFEHAQLDAQLQHLHQMRFLTPEQELEATRLKKLKLQLKDAMRRSDA